MTGIITALIKVYRLLQRIRGFRLPDDDFMTKCFEGNKEAAEQVLRIVLEKADIKVENVITQYSMKKIKGNGKLPVTFRDTALFWFDYTKIFKFFKVSLQKQIPLSDENTLCPAKFVLKYKLTEEPVLFIGIYGGKQNG